MIEGVTVDLRKMDESDIEQVRIWRNSKEVSEHMLSRNSISQEQQVKWFQSVKENDSQIYFIIQSKSGSKLGVVNFNSIDKKNRTAEPGLYIGDLKERNSLFGMEAYFLLLKYGFEQLDIEKVYGTALASNPTALKMNKSFGYTIEEVVKKGIFIDGVSCEVVKLYLLKKDFYLSPMALFFQRTLK